MSNRLFSGPFQGVPREVHRGKNVSVQVLSRHCVENGRGVHEEPFALIGITEPQNYHPRLTECEYRRGYLPVHFHDVPHDFEQKGKQYETISEEQAGEIVQFVREMHTLGVRLFVVHCEAGISRSAAVGAAIWQEYNRGHGFFHDRYCPNRTVHYLMRQAFKSLPGSQP